MQECHDEINEDDEVVYLIPHKESISVIVIFLLFYKTWKWLQEQERLAKLPRHKMSVVEAPAICFFSEKQFDPASDCWEPTNFHFI